MTAGEEFKRARTAAGLSQDDVSAAAGLSRVQYGRIERGLAPEVSIQRVATIASVLGLEASLRFFRSGDPVRDAAHAALLERLHGRCHRSLVWRTEVPFPAPGDQRAWDALVRGVDPVSGDPWRVGVEAETRPNDLQALDRRLARKERVGGVDWMVLLLLASRAQPRVPRGARIRAPGTVSAGGPSRPGAPGCRRAAREERVDPALRAGLVRQTYLSAGPRHGNPSFRSRLDRQTNGLRRRRHEYADLVRLATRTARMAAARLLIGPLNERPTATCALDERNRAVGLVPGGGGYFAVAGRGRRRGAGTAPRTRRATAARAWSRRSSAMGRGGCGSNDGRPMR